jgi:acyl-CoA thioesterase-1
VCARRRRLVVAGVLAALLATLFTGYVADRARGADAGHCQRFAADSVERAARVTGSGQRVVVIGDSYSAGLGLADPAASWPARLPGSVHVAAFSGSGFSEDASTCGAVSFADRAPAAVRDGADLVVVEGGLNDYDQPAAAITAGFTRLMDALDGLDVVVVGPVSAPSRAGAVPRVDALLAALCAQHHVRYVSTSDLALDYLGDDLHLVPASHVAFGDAVAGRISDLPAA